MSKGEQHKDDPGNGEEISFEEFIDEDNAAGQVDLSAKVKKLKAQLSACQKEKQDNLLGWQRSRADYANLQNDFDKRKQSFVKLGTEAVVVDLLSVIDSFRLAFADPSWSSAPADWRTGIERVCQQLITALEQHGLARIEAEGKPFNPVYHESVGFIPTDSADNDQVVLEVVKDGYLLDDKVIRAAQVKIGMFKQ
ncbi:MAG: nucleotide exchange factor GrpE [Candidatus Paceibacterota bacterium]